MRCPSTDYKATNTVKILLSDFKSKPHSILAKQVEIVIMPIMTPENLSLTINFLTPENQILNLSNLCFLHPLIFSLK
jgi:hypothetical protein